MEFEKLLPGFQTERLSVNRHLKKINPSGLTLLRRDLAGNWEKVIGCLFFDPADKDSGRDIDRSTLWVRTEGSYELEPHHPYLITDDRDNPVGITHGEFPELYIPYPSFNANTWVVCRSRRTIHMLLNTAEAIEGKGKAIAWFTNAHNSDQASRVELDRSDYRHPSLKEMRQIGPPTSEFWGPLYNDYWMLYNPVKDIVDA